MNKRKAYPTALIAPLEQNKTIKITKNHISTIINILESHELVLLEIQGTIERDNSDDINKHIGKLWYDSTKERVYLTIGYHRLEGKIETLLQPFAVLHCRSKENTQSDNKNFYQDQVIDVLEIIHKRIIFNTRPEPIT